MRIDRDNRVVFWRQSSFNTFTQCPERLRSKPDVEIPTDAAALGTALHAAIEADLAPSPISVEQVFSEAHEALECEWGQGVRMVQNDFGASLTVLQNCLRAWIDHPIRAQLRHSAESNRLAIESSFERPVGSVRHQGEHWEVYIEGRIDAVESGGTPTVWDWKTSSRRYEEWEHQRWAKQPTFYTYATGINAFHYLVFMKRMTKDVGVQVVPVTRDRKHWSWLEVQLQLATQYVLANDAISPWITRDDSALCSPKWCHNWDECKGRYLGPDAW